MVKGIKERKLTYKSVITTALNLKTIKIINITQYDNKKLPLSRHTSKKTRKNNENQAIERHT